MCSVNLASALDGGLGSIVVHVHSSGFNPAGGSSHDNCRRPFPCARPGFHGVEWAFFGKESNIDQKSTHEGFLIFASCFVPCKKCGFLGFFSVDFCCCFCFSKWSSRHPGTLEAVRWRTTWQSWGPTVTGSEFPTWGINSHNSPSVFFLLSYGDLVTSLKTIRFSFSTWKMVVGKRISFCESLFFGCELLVSGRQVQWMPSSGVLSKDFNPWFLRMQPVEESAKEFWKRDPCRNAAGGS